MNTSGFFLLPPPLFFSGGGFGFNFGGGGNEEQEPQTPKGPDLIIDLECTLDDLYVGKKITIKRVKSILEKAPGKRQCNCRRVMRTQQMGPGMFTQTMSTECDRCDNLKFVPEDVSLDIEVDPGMSDGHIIRFFEEGDAMIDGEPGDLLFRIKEVESPTGPVSSWSRMPGNKLDLKLLVEIDLKEALLGFTKVIHHLDGRAVQLNEAGVTQSGHVAVIKGEGMPKHDDITIKGDLYVEYLVKLPETLSQSQKKQIEKTF